MLALVKDHETWVWMKVLMGFSCAGMVALRAHWFLERAARRREELEKSAVRRPSTPEEMEALRERLLEAAAERFQVKRARLAEGARFEEDLRIPRGEVARLIEDLEIDLGLEVDAGSAAGVGTFRDLAALFVGRDGGH